MGKLAVAQSFGAEDFDIVLMAHVIAEGAAAGVKFLVHLVAETPPGFAPGLALAMPVFAAAALAALFATRGLFRLRAVVYRKVFADPHADLGNDASLVIMRCFIEAYIINKSSNVKPRGGGGARMALRRHVGPRGTDRTTSGVNSI